jgi:hypothetical protein
VFVRPSKHTMIYSSSWDCRVLGKKRICIIWIKGLCLWISES